MKFPAAIVIAAALIAAALFFQPPKGQGQAVPMASYQLAPQADTGNAWVMNTVTGRLRLCLPPPQDDFSQAPECFSWTK